MRYWLKGLILDGQQQVLASLRKSDDSLAKELYISWKCARSVLAKQYYLPPQQRTLSFDSLQQHTTILEQQLSQRSDVFSRLQRLQSVTVKEISVHLKTGEAAIEFIRFHYYHRQWTNRVWYGAIILFPGDSNAVFVPLFEEKILEKMLRRAEEGFSWAIDNLYCRGEQNHRKTKGRTLCQLVWRPLQKYLSKVHTIYWAPAGLLHRLSFQALCTGHNQRLIDRYTLYQVFSTRSLVWEDLSTPQPSSIELWGNIDYQGSLAPKEAARENLRTAGRLTRHWPALPGTRQEVESIAKLFQKAGLRATVISGNRATEEKFKAYDGRSPVVLHLATHGFIRVLNGRSLDTKKPNKQIPFENAPDAMLGSSLLMAGCNQMKARLATDDGILTAYEIAQMDLRGTRLAVLSACNTALGDLKGSEGVIGLQRALKLAGVDQMIASLWKVPDKETAVFMRLFYTNWLAGKTATNALQLAQLQMKKKYASPFYWAAFVLVN